MEEELLQFISTERVSSYHDSTFTYTTTCLPYLCILLVIFCVFAVAIFVFAVFVHYLACHTFGVRVRVPLFAAAAAAGIWCLSF